MILRFSSAPLLVAFVCSAGAQVSVLTYQYDNTRAGANVKEITLNPGNVNATGFGKLLSYPVDGYIYGQPLYLASVTIPNVGTHNVVYVATEHDSVYAFDADANSSVNSAPLWHVNFLNAAAGVTSVPAEDTGCGQIEPEIGITSTPVIDPVAGTIFVVAMTKETTAGTASYVQRLHALDLTTGTEKPGSPVVIQATYPGTGEGGTVLTFNPKAYKQRPGLLLLGGVVYSAWSSHCDIGRYHGWLIGYESQSLKQVAIYNDTPNGNEGSFWAAGAAPAVDSNGNIYLVSANGTFDPSGTDLGESYIKLSTAQKLSVIDYFTPFNYDQLNAGDVDTGSAGVALIGDEAGSPAHPHLMAGAGKEGRIYLLDRDNLGKLNPGADTQIVQSIAGAITGLFGNPAYFNHAIYFCGSGDSLKAFPIFNGQIASSGVSRTGLQFGYPGCVPTISSNGNANGIVWIIDPAGTLRAYDASNLTNELYDSAQNPGRDALGNSVKFSAPTVANGKVFAGTEDSLAIYGLLSASTGRISISNAASGDSTVLAPGSIASIYGMGLARSTATANSFPLPATLGDASVSVNGVGAPILYASSTQINFQIPFEVSMGPAAVIVNADGTNTGTSTIQIQAAAPGLFGQPPGSAAIVNQDGSLNSQSQPAPAGTVIEAFATGLGAVDPPVGSGAAAGSTALSTVITPVTATVGITPATVQFAGLAPGFAGLYQVNILIPQLSPGQYLLQISMGAARSNTVPLNTR